MRANINQVERDQESNTAETLKDNLISKKVDMNDLLARIRKEELHNKKINIIIFSSVVLVLGFSLFVFI